MYGASNFPNSQINPLFIIQQGGQNIPVNSNSGLMFPNSYPAPQFNYPDNRNNQYNN